MKKVHLLGFVKASAVLATLWSKHAIVGVLSGGNCAGLWGLGDLSDPETAAVLQQAQEQPDLFVLKPQSEGGGNKIHGEAAQWKLHTKKHLSAYNLTQRIRPLVNK